MLSGISDPCSVRLDPTLRTDSYLERMTPVAAHDALVEFAEQRERQLVLVAESPVRFGTIGSYTENVGTALS
jgi:hypothetical protein